MRAVILAAAVAAATPASADACVKLPAPSATAVAVHHHVVRVCGHTVARAPGIRAASAAGHRVAWIEERHRGGVRTSLVTVARVGRTVRVLERYTAERRRTKDRATLRVILTRRGDVAWASSTYGEYPGVVAVKQPGRKVRTLFEDYSSGLALEDGRTLRWTQGFGDLYFFDLRSEPCPSRSRYHEFARTDRVVLTRSRYGRQDSGHVVVRACDLATGRDHVAAQSYSEYDYESTLDFVGFDRTWAVFTDTINEFDDGHDSTITAFDAVSGRGVSYHSEYNGGREYPLPTTAYAVTDRAVLTWIAGTTLYALAQGQVRTLDSGGALAGLRAEGDAVVWTHDGAPRSVTP
jgi:hypothetical protein